MTSQEEQMLNSLVERVNATQLTEKDPDAATLLQRGFSSNPDSLYILSQSVLVQNIALEQAHAQLAAAQEQVKQLQQQVQQPAHSSSFLGNLLGHRDPQPPPLPQQPQYQPVYSPQAEPEYQNPPYNPPYQGQPYQGQPYQGQPYGGPQYVAAPSQPSFLRSAAQTAAGVAAGALAFEGVEALLHGGFGHPGMGYGMGGWGMPGIGMGMGPGMMGGMGFERPIEENVVNNYYDSPGGGGEHEHFHESASQQDAQVSDASWSDPQSEFDNNSSYDDSGNFSDDSGGFDNGGGDGGLL